MREEREGREELELEGERGMGREEEAEVDMAAMEEEEEKGMKSLSGGINKGEMGDIIENADEIWF